MRLFYETVVLRISLLYRNDDAVVLVHCATRGVS